MATTAVEQQQNSRAQCVMGCRSSAGSQRHNSQPLLSPSNNAMAVLVGYTRATQPIRAGIATDGPGEGSEE